LLIGIYYSPIWWVALTAPNYPEETFSDGVRIDFHMNGVFNRTAYGVAEKYSSCVSANVPLCLDSKV
jgi:hypothetical protein